MASSREGPLAARRSPEPFCGPGSGSSELGHVRVGTVLQPGPPGGRCLEAPGQHCRCVLSASLHRLRPRVPAVPREACRAAPCSAVVWSAFTKPVLTELLPPAFVHPCGCWPHTCPCSCVQFPHGPLCHRLLSCAAPSYCVFSSHLHSHRERGRKGVLRVSRGKIGDWILAVPRAVWGEQSVEPRPDSHSLGGRSAVRVTLPS